ncbi:MAG: hypothetical protein ISQ23_07420 [Alphaproteobacteria bacterium]|nr:hypothetical protein [Alphaproteobacteria bacterium]MBL6777324.1 hypothetical protein [Alphaproteobacteria bacterium]
MLPRDLICTIDNEAASAKLEIQPFFLFSREQIMSELETHEGDVHVERFGIAQQASQKYMPFVIATTASCAPAQPLV